MLLGGIAGGLFILKKIFKVLGFAYAKKKKKKNHTFRVRRWIIFFIIIIVIFQWDLVGRFLCGYVCGGVCVFG